MPCASRLILTLLFCCAVTSNVWTGEDALLREQLNKVVIEKLSKKIDIDVKALAFDDVIKLIAKETGIRIFIDPKLSALKKLPITYKANAVTAEEALQSVTRMAKVEFGVILDIVHITEKFQPAEPAPVVPPAISPPALNEPDWKKKLRLKMQQPVTFDFKNLPLDKVVAELSEKTKLQIRAKLRPGETPPTVNLRVTEQPLEKSLNFIGALLEYSIELQETGIEFHKTNP